MSYTEIKERNNKKYFYRVLSIRKNNKVGKKRVYLGVNLNQMALTLKEAEADKIIKKEKISRNLEKIKKVVLPILKKYKIKKAGLFGSYSRGEETKKSDIDLLIQPSEGMGLEYVGLALDLKKSLKKKLKKEADIVSYNALNHLIKDNILKDERSILNG